jgi:hypothetical protein
VGMAAIWRGDCNKSLQIRVHKAMEHLWSCNICMCFVHTVCACDKRRPQGASRVLWGSSPAITGLCARLNSAIIVVM